MSDPFANFGIQHLSPSSINLFVEDRAWWTSRYLLKVKDDAGPKAWCGSAVEAGLNFWLHERDQVDANIEALTRAHACFEQDAQGEIRSDIDSARDEIEPMLEQAIAQARHWPRPDAMQLKVEYRPEGIEVPIIGFIDYLWPDFLVDCKTTRRMPSEVSSAHGRQVSLYAFVKQRPGRLLYVTPKKSQVIELLHDDVERHMKYLTRCAHSVRAFLSMVRTPEGAIAECVPNFDHNYLWKSEAAKAAAAQYWSL
jgi:hypothetical protein